MARQRALPRLLRLRACLPGRLLDRRHTATLLLLLLLLIVKQTATTTVTTTTTAATTTNTNTTTNNNHHHHICFSFPNPPAQHWQRPAPSLSRDVEL